jgi:hypothetical protein
LRSGATVPTDTNIEQNIMKLDTRNNHGQASLDRDLVRLPVEFGP